MVLFWVCIWYHSGYAWYYSDCVYGTILVIHGIILIVYMVPFWLCMVLFWLCIWYHSGYPWYYFDCVYGTILVMHGIILIVYMVPFWLCMVLFWLCIWYHSGYPWYYFDCVYGAILVVHGIFLIVYMVPFWLCMVLFWLCIWYHSGCAWHYSDRTSCHSGRALTTIARHLIPQLKLSTDLFYLKLCIFVTFEVILFYWNANEGVIWAKNSDICRRFTKNLRSRRAMKCIMKAVTQSYLLFVKLQYIWRNHVEIPQDTNLPLVFSVSCFTTFFLLWGGDVIAIYQL